MMLDLELASHELAAPARQAKVTGRQGWIASGLLLLVCSAALLLFVPKEPAAGRSAQELQELHGPAKAEQARRTAAAAASSKDRWGTSAADLQEAGLMLLGGASRWVWQQLAPSETSPPYMFDDFTRYVQAFVDLFLEMQVTPHCEADVRNLALVVQGAAADLRKACEQGACENDGVARLPKLSTDPGIPLLLASLGYPGQLTGLGFFTQQPPTAQDFLKEVGAPNCSELDEELQRRFCAPYNGRPGWRFWWEEFLPSLIEAMSCDWDKDVGAHATWQWLQGGEVPNDDVLGRPSWSWDVQRFIADAELQGLKKPGDDELVFKAWRLTYRYLTDSVAYTFESAARYHQKELGRFVPFLGEYMDRRPLPPGCDYPSQGVQSEHQELKVGCPPTLFTLYDFLTTERQTFYGPLAWRFMHTVAEAAASAEDGTAAGAARGMRLLEGYKTFLPLLAHMHNCPHCREHLLTKVQFGAYGSYQPNLTLEEHQFREFGPLRDFQSSAEIMLYPLEWIMLVGGPGHVMGASLTSKEGQDPKTGGWENLLLSGNATDPSQQNLTVRLSTLQRPEQLRIFVWKLHNAVDSSLESKYEERNRPMPAGYWPVSRFYSAIEPWGQTGKSVASSWGRFRVLWQDACQIEAGTNSSWPRYAEAFFPLLLMPGEESSLSPADVQHFQVLQNGEVRWRIIGLAYLKLAELLHRGARSDGDACSEYLYGALRQGSDKFCTAVRGGISVQSVEGNSSVDASGTPCASSIATLAEGQEAWADALAHWLCDWSLLSQLLRRLDGQVSCVSNFLVDSGLLQTKFGFLGH